MSSALPIDPLPPRPHGRSSRSFKAGDSIIEKHSGAWGGGIMFGVVVKIDRNPEILDVIFPIGRLYSFASHCQLYEDWLKDHGV